MNGMREMERKVSDLAPLDRAQASEQEIESRVANEPPTAACACPSCGTYRWYPPLLVLSTILTGVFCWLYVTKPVFMAQGEESIEEEAVAAVEEKEQPVLRSAVDSVPRSTGASQEHPLNLRRPHAEQDTLDPKAPGLPGEKREPRSPQEVARTEFVPVGDVIREEGGEDIVQASPEDIVKTGEDSFRIMGSANGGKDREGPSLFTPFPKSGGEEDAEGDVIKGPVKVSDRVRVVPNLFEGGEQPIRVDRSKTGGMKPVHIQIQAPDPPAQPSRSDEDDFQVSPSFMADMTTAANRKTKN